MRYGKVLTSTLSVLTRPPVSGPASRRTKDTPSCAGRVLTSALATVGTGEAPQAWAQAHFTCCSLLAALRPATPPPMITTSAPLGTVTPVDSARSDRSLLASFGHCCLLSLALGTSLRHCRRCGATPTRAASMSTDLSVLCLLARGRHARNPGNCRPSSISSGGVSVAGKAAWTESFQGALRAPPSSETHRRHRIRHGAAEGCAVRVVSKFPRIFPTACTWRARKRSLQWLNALPS